MVKELLSRVLNRSLHIVSLFLLFSLLTGGGVYAQSVLLPADIVIVSVNSSNDSYDFIPLVELEEGTTLWFSNGTWDKNELNIEGQEVKVTVIEPIEAGTNIHINEIEDPRVTVEGQLIFSEEGNRVFAYQKDEGITRVIYGVGWGGVDIWNPESEIGSEIPPSISKNEKTLLLLGLKKNYQYYLRNGASGTPSMLSSFVGDPAKWKGQDSKEFPSFRTAFRILRPPVVLFDESISTVKEGEVITLNVAIFEHDGSRLTVDAVLNEASSTTDTTDVKGFVSYSFNFTGLIGDAVYAVEIPTLDDEQYEGTENSFFELQNLSKGEYGDFVSHVAFMPDNETPDIQITNISYLGNPDFDFIELQNTERFGVDLSGWQLTARGFTYSFNENDYLEPYQKFKLFHPNKGGKESEGEAWFSRNSGTLELKSPEGNRVSSLKYLNQSNDEVSEIDTETEITATELNNQTLTKAIPSGRSTIETKNAESAKKRTPGWYLLETGQIEEAILAGKKMYSWNESMSSFEERTSYSDSQELNERFFAFFSDEELSIRKEIEFEIEEDSLISLLKSNSNTQLDFSLSGTDVDENGVINGAEGFNLIHNHTSSLINVSDLFSNLEGQLKDGTLYPYIFLLDNDIPGWNFTSILSRQDTIPAFSSFWIKADSLFESTSLSYQIEPLITGEIIEDTEREPLTELSLSLNTDGFSKQVQIDFFDSEEELKRDVIIPGLEPELTIFEKEYLFLGTEYGLGWHSKVHLRVTNDQKMVFPIAFSTSESGTFTLSVDDWVNVPADWKIIIEDIDSKKEFEINQRWDFEFEHTLSVEKSNATEIDLSDDREEEIQYRFNLVIVPPGFKESVTDLPEEITLNQNYPNPFNPTTTISFYLPESVPVKLSVFNVVGQPVAVLTEGTLGAGDHEFEWDATGLPSGMYIYQFEVGNKIMTRKMTLVK